MRWLVYSIPFSDRRLRTTSAARVTSYQGVSRSLQRLSSPPPSTLAAHAGELAPSSCSCSCTSNRRLSTAPVRIFCIGVANTGAGALSSRARHLSNAGLSFTASVMCKNPCPEPSGCSQWHRHRTCDEVRAANNCPSSRLRAWVTYHQHFRGSLRKRHTVTAYAPSAYFHEASPHHEDAATWLIQCDGRVR